MPTSRKRDDNGFLLVKGCPISSFGIFDYSAGQLGLPGDPNRIVKVFRPESAVSDPAAIESFKNVPLINDHEMLSGFNGDEDATAPEDYGVSGILTSNVYYEAPWMRGDIKVFSREMQQSLEDGKKDLSLGYACDFEVKPGVWNGQPYEVIQNSMRGNHIALVDEGRVAGAKVLDGLCFDHLQFDVRPSDKETAMKKKFTSKKVAADNAVAQLKQLLPALEQFLNEEGQEPEHQDASGAGEENGAVANPAAVNVDPNSAEGEAAAQSDPGESGEAEAGGSDLPALIAKVEAVLAELKAAVGGQPGGEGNDEGQPGKDGTEGLNPSVDEAGAEAGDPANAADADAEAGAVGEGQGKASPGPAAGTNATASDAALRNFYSDLAVKTRVYDRLSKVTGAFDCASMDSRAVFAYGVKKLNISCAKGQEGVALDAYLNGVEAANKVTKQRAAVRVGDAVQSSTEMDAYLKGVK